MYNLYKTWSVCGKFDETVAVSTGKFTYGGSVCWVLNYDTLCTFDVAE